MAWNIWRDDTVVCRRVRLDTQGYTDNGLYYGTGRAVWYVELEDKRSGYVRAYDRRHALETARKYPAHWGIR